MVFCVKTSMRKPEKEVIWKPQAAGRENKEIRANPEIGCSFFKNLCRWNMRSGSSARSGTANRTVLRENHQIALFSASWLQVAYLPSKPTQDL